MHLAFVRNEEFQQFRPAGSERTKEWMSLFSSFRPGLGAPRRSVQTPIVAMSLSSLGPCVLLYVAAAGDPSLHHSPTPCFHKSPLCTVFIDLLSFFGLFSGRKFNEPNTGRAGGRERGGGGVGWGAAFLKANTDEV